MAICTAAEPLVCGSGHRGIALFPRPPWRARELLAASPVSGLDWYLSAVSSIGDLLLDRSPGC